MPVLGKPQRSTALSATVLVAAGLLMYASHLARQGALAERDAAIARLSRTESGLQQMQGEQEDFQKQAEIFQSLEAKGFVAGAKPVEWAELLHRLRRQVGLPAMQHQFSPATTGDEDASFNIQTTPVKLQLQLLHEEDLLIFLERLQEEAGALVVVRHCRLTRPPPPAAHLGADCETVWHTASRKGAEGP